MPTYFNTVLLAVLIVITFATYKESASMRATMSTLVLSSECVELPLVTPEVLKDIENLPEPAEAPE